MEDLKQIIQKSPLWNPSVSALEQWNPAVASSHGQTSATRFTLYAVLIATVFFAGIAPTLSWLQFSGGSENLVAGTVLEMRRGGPWFVPTLKGAPRTTKPPLTTWLIAAAVRPATVEALSNRQQRERAYHELAWEMRWPSLASACLLLIAAAWMGRLLVGNEVGIAAAIMAGSTILFLRFMRSATTDVQLALWVTVTNLCWVAAIVQPRGRRVLMLLGGVTLGLALMSKGPVALAQTTAPFAFFAIWTTLANRDLRWRHLPWWTLIGSFAIALLIAAPWPAYVLLRMSGQLELWTQDVAGGGLAHEARNPFWQYGPMLWLLLPWLLFFLLGFARILRKRSTGGVLALCLAAAPVLVMSCFPEKNSRYLLPMIAPAAIVAAIGFLKRDDQALASWWHLAMGGTWGLLGIVAFALPIAGATVLKTVHGNLWWNWPTALVLIVALLLVLAVAWWWDRRRELGVLPAAMIVMLAAQALYQSGYRYSEGGVSDVKPLADAIVAKEPLDARIWGFSEGNHFDKVPIDFPIYLNRVVLTAEHATTLPSSGSQVMLIFRANNEPLPRSLAGWTFLGRVPRNKGHWEAYARPN